MSLSDHTGAFQENILFSEKLYTGVGMIRDDGSMSLFLMFPSQLNNFNSDQKSRLPLMLASLLSLTVHFPWEAGGKWSDNGMILRVWCDAEHSPSNTYKSHWPITKLDKVYWPLSGLSYQNYFVFYRGGHFEKNVEHCIRFCSDNIVCFECAPCIRCYYVTRVIWNVSLPFTKKWFNIKIKWHNYYI